MLFNSYYFIFLFLPAVFLGFFCIDRKHLFSMKALWCIAASVFFYSFWNVENLPFIALSIAINYTASILTRRTLVARRIDWAKSVLFVGIALNVGILVYFKYCAFFVGILNDIFNVSYKFQNKELPLGISFFTFQQIIYLVDIYKNRIEQVDIKNYVLCVCFFPHLIAGPIIRYQHLLPQLTDPAVFRVRPAALATGLGFFILGLAKKVLLADTLAPLADPVFASVASGPVSPGDAWFAALAYTMQLYFDFAGYSDMAVGLGLLFGIELPVNFNSPYKATGPIDFWRRWHISLSTFLRDYLYIPLGGSRAGRCRQYANLLVTMLIGGLWHGAGWNFILWGALHGVGLVANHLWRGLGSREQRARWLPAYLSRILTFLFIVWGWVLFRAGDMVSVRGMYRAMLGFGDGAGLTNWPLKTLVLGIALTIAWFCPNTQDMLGRYRSLTERYSLPRFSVFSWKLDLRWAWVFSCVFLASMACMSGHDKFLYFNF